MKSLAVVFLSFMLLLASCDSDDNVSTAAERKPFAIEGTVQQVTKTFSDGKVKSAVYRNEQNQQKVAEVEFHPNGQAKIDKRFVNDTLQGESWCYYEDGKPWSLNTFNNGLNDGPYKTWHENGQLYIQGQYENGLKSGEWFTYFANGSINTRGLYKNDEKVGIWNSYNLEGTMKREQDFGAGGDQE
ncbi:MAG: toxin-antitoxin system YwqK family antitoxin [Flavobacteriales bacterium]